VTYRQIRDELVFEADGKCVIDGSTEMVQAHHLLTRTCKRHREDRRNLLVVCGKCHARPVMIMKWLEENRPEQAAWVAQIRRQWLAGKKYDFEN